MSPTNADWLLVEKLHTLYPTWGADQVYEELSGLVDIETIRYVLEHL